MNYQQIIQNDLPDYQVPLHSTSILRLDYFDGSIGGKLGKFERLSSGAVRIPASATVADVLPYKTPDGRTIQEYRPPGEVFAPESLASFKSAPVVVGHPPGGQITPENWRKFAVGHVESVHQDGKFISADLIITDEAAIRDIENGDLVELSPGYRMSLDPTAGTSPEGRAYDQVQRKIRYNHLALLPAGKGRSGSEVKLRLDSFGEFEPVNDGTVLRGHVDRVRGDSPIISRASIEADARRRQAAQASAMTPREEEEAEAGRRRMQAQDEQTAPNTTAPARPLRFTAEESQALKTLASLGPKIEAYVASRTDSSETTHDVLARKIRAAHK